MYNQINKSHICDNGGDVMVNVNKLKGKFTENKKSVKDVAEILGIDTSTLYRKLKDNGDKLTIKEADRLVTILNLSLVDANSIFFSQLIA